jgi:low affinity Fe/Cu permease
MNEAFHKIAAKISYITGTAWAFLAALAIIIVWALTGPIFGFSTTWQLVINTGTTIVTFLMVFLIQNTQNRDSKALHIKLDELLKSEKGARTSLVNLEELPDAVLEELAGEFKAIQTRYSKKLTGVTKPSRKKHREQAIHLLGGILSLIQKPLSDKK